MGNTLVVWCLKFLFASLFHHHAALLLVLVGLVTPVVVVLAVILSIFRSLSHGTLVLPSSSHLYSASAITDE